MHTQQTGVVKFFHSVPRLSNSAQFTDLFSSSPSSSANQEYILSTSLIAGVLIASVAFWLLLLLVLKILGPSRLCECCADTGLAGNDVQKPDLVALHAMHPLAAAKRYEREYGDMESAIDTRVTDTTSAVMNAQEQALWVEKVELIERRVRNVRIASIFFALLLIASSVVMVLFGLNELQAVADQLTGVSTTLGDTFSKASDLTGSFVEKGVVAMRNRDQLVENLGIICPNCDAQGEVLVHDGDFKAVPMGYLVNTLTTPLMALGDLGLAKILSLQEALAAISAGFHGIADEVDGYSWFYPTAMALLAVMDVIALVYIIGIATAWQERSSAAFQKIQTWILLPLFVLLVIATTLVCSLFSVFTVMDADFCTGTASTLGSPDSSVAAILDARLYETDPAHAAISHFTQGCKGDDGLSDMHLLSSKIDSASVARKDFLQEVNSHDANAFSEALGISPEELSTILGEISSLDESLANLDAKTSNTTAVLDCPSMNVAYSDIAYSGVCDAGAQALTWIFSCLGAVAISGMSIITLRSSWRDVQDFVDPSDVDHKGALPYGDGDDYGEEGVDVIEEMASLSYEDDDPIYEADYTGAAPYHEDGEPYYR